MSERFSSVYSSVESVLALDFKEEISEAASFQAVLSESSLFVIVEEVLSSEEVWL